MSDLGGDSQYLLALTRLSPDELAVMRYRCAGRTSDEIASLTSMPPETARGLLANIYDKLGITWQQETTSLAALTRFCPYVPQVSAPDTPSAPEQATQPLPPQPSERALQLVQEDDEALTAQRAPAAQEQASEHSRTPLIVFGSIAALAILVLIGLLVRSGGASDATPTPNSGGVAGTSTAGAGAATTATTAPSPTPTPKPTETPVPTATPTPTAAPSPTPTAEPPTPTPAPTPTSVPTAAPTPTGAATSAPTVAPTPVTGTLAYEASWTAGADNWQLGTGWAATGGSLESSSGAGSLAAPFAPSGPNFAIETKITLLAGSSACPDGVGLFGRGTASTPLVSGYSGITCQNAWAILASRRTGTDQDTLGHGTTTMDQAEHTYRFEIQGNQQRLFIDSVFAGETTNSRWTEPGIVGIFLSGDYQVKVGEFRVYQLP